MARVPKFIRLLLLTAVAPQILLAASVVGSKHDLSASNPRGALWNNPSTEVCVFCHTPHMANQSLGPLWNRKISNMGSFQMYTSPTMDSTCAATPSPVSLACLSCHDDSNGGAVNAADTHDGLVNNSNNDPYGSGYYSEPNCMACHPAGGVKPGVWWQVGPDLTNDHPISFVYSDSQALDPELTVAPDDQVGWSDVKLFNGRVECPTCHNPHDSTFAPFLRKDNSTSGLCYTCHIK